MKYAMRMCVVVLAVSFAVIGCEGGNLSPTGASDPLDSKVKTSVTLSGGNLIVVPPVDNGFLVNVVENGRPVVVPVGNVVATVWNGERAGWLPGGGVRVGFNANSITLPIPAGEREGQIAYLTKDGRTLWTNVDFVDSHGVVVDQQRDLILLHA